MENINEFVDKKSDLEELQDILATSRKNRENFRKLLIKARDVWYKDTTNPELLEIFSKL